MPWQTFGLVQQLATDLPMRVLLIAAVIGILVQPAFAFNDDLCSSLKESARYSYNEEIHYRSIAVSYIPNGFSATNNVGNKIIRYFRTLRMSFWKEPHIMPMST